LTAWRTRYCNARQSRLRNDDENMRRQTRYTAAMSYAIRAPFLRNTTVMRRRLKTWLWCGKARYGGTVSSKMDCLGHLPSHPSITQHARLSALGWAESFSPIRPAVPQRREPAFTRVYARPPSLVAAVRVTQRHAAACRGSEQVRCRMSPYVEVQAPG